MPASGRADSQGICFLGKVKFAEFVREHLGEPAPMERACSIGCARAAPATCIAPAGCAPRAACHPAGEWPGPIVEAETNEVLGYHKGFWFHTVGQRKGIQLSGGPW